MQLIVALDFLHTSDAMRLVDQLNPAHCILKIGLALYTHAGPVFVRTLVARGFKIFLDLKFHDIPNTVAQACQVAADLGVWMMNVHAMGGSKMLDAARNALLSYGEQKPYLIAVTVLTSLDEDAIRQIGFPASLTDTVKHLAYLSQQSELDGIVCSAQEVSMIKELCGAKFITVTPGIRLPEEESHDQIRCVTPQKALEYGSDFIVMGRSITLAADPALKIQTILSAIQHEY